jgi:tetratricopeptide (TPR) repeat protein
MPRIVLAAVLLLLSGEAAGADDFKTCASGAPDYAIMACTNLIEGGKLDKREQAVAYTNRGVAFRIRGGVQRALADLNRAIELDSSLAPIYANRGLVYMYMGEPDPALADFNRALELDPNNPAFYLNRGAVHQRLKDKDRALADYTRAIELQPNNAMAYTNRGVLYELEGDHGRAIMDLNHAVELAQSSQGPTPIAAPPICARGTSTVHWPILTGALSWSREPRRLLPAGRRQT